MAGASVFDETFGEIHYGHGWIGRTTFGVFGSSHPVKIMISCDEGEEIETEQKDAYQGVVARGAELCREVENRILGYYLEEIEEIRERVGPRFADSYAPLVKSVKELSALVQFTQVTVSYNFPDLRGVNVGFLFDCSWEPEHGLAVKIERGEVVDVGTQDIVL